jgi:hypothetical protein
MSTRLNKPKVFLSHAKDDINFINQLKDDLRKCQIEPWLDSEEIRHGKPWLDAIFEDGIPTCDSVLVYFTENSLKSVMVKKEIDSGLLRQLKENSVSFLPYVNDAEIRQKLRSDIQALQVLEWNNNNYSSLLPQVVAEVWRSFLERMISNAIKSERVRRLEAELELEKLKRSFHNGVFPESENRDFGYIWEKLDRFESVNFEEKVKYEKNQWKSIRTHNISVHIGSLIPFISKASNSDYHNYWFQKLLEDLLKSHLKKEERLDQKDILIDLKSYPDIGDELLMYGFVQRVHIPPPQHRDLFVTTIMHQSIKLVYSERIDRFKYWLAFKGFLPQDIIWRTDD